LIATSAERAADPAFRLEGRVAIVTGALGLLGRAFSEALLAAGAALVVADLDGAACRRRAEELGRAHGGLVHGFPVDITRPDSLGELRDAVLAASGRLDVLVNSAAIDDKFSEGAAAEESRFESYPLALWRRALDVNLTGTFLACQVLGAQMASQGRGSIINIASTYGVVAPDQRIYQGPHGEQRFWKSAAYPAAKAGVIALSRFLGTYWADAGVRVNALSPGGVGNGQDEHFVASYSARTPLGRMARPGEMGGAVVFLASDASSYVTASNLIVDGGWTAW
jgi:NAD(P)-dependent dehydrogenase (short-subunit alcohol dehydrogenase family)